jgi:hypothetical protein
MKSPVRTVKPQDTVAHARAIIEKYRVRQLSVTQPAALRNGLYLILLRVRFWPPEGVPKAIRAGLSQRCPPVARAESRTSAHTRRQIAGIFPSHHERLHRACIRDRDGHDHLPAGGHPHEGILESGEHRFSLPDGLSAHGSDLRAQAVGFEFRVDGINGRAQMLLTQRIDAYLYADGHGNPKISIPLDWIACLVPALHPAMQNCYLLESRFREHFRRARRALLSSSNGYYRLPLDLGKLSDFCG